MQAGVDYQGEQWQREKMIGVQWDGGGAVRGAAGCSSGGQSWQDLIKPSFMKWARASVIFQ